MKESYFLDIKKSVRDLVHGYVGLTEFELLLIDSAPFQRLKDIRQLTCQHVYPDARHTRFEHSLGVLHLIDQAIGYINKNGYISNPPDLPDDNEPIFDKNMKFNMRLAALLHDVGHCPFSHMGETQLDALDVKDALSAEINNPEFKFSENFKNHINTKEPEKIGAIHEQLSCIMILVYYYDRLNEIDLDLSTGEKLNIDFEFIFRSILGIKYQDSKMNNYKRYRIKDIAIELLNSKIFDMDKLDYVMRDSFYTGINTPKIDVVRLFQNMNISQRYKLTFNSKSVPVLQNIIETRDNLYMYVYNHHAVVYSDFIYTYIFRRMRLNAEKRGKENPEKSCLIEKGVVPSDYFFSIEAIVDHLYSDSDIICALMVQYRLSLEDDYNDDIDIVRATSLVQQLFNRQFLKPFWKNLFEFNSFMNKHFANEETTRKTLGEFVCKDVTEEHPLSGSEFCSQLAKHVIFITKELERRKELPFSLNDGEFFVVKRKNNFFLLDTIGNLEIHVRKNCVYYNSSDINYSTNKYYVKSLTSILPQKNYLSFFDKNGFYIYVRPYEWGNETETSLKKERYYETIEKIFVFVAKEFIGKGHEWFVETFQGEETPQSKEKIHKELENTCAKYLETNI